nr:MAG TPA: hypothetical protein [Caudoviricetes sp.]
MIFVPSMVSPPKIRITPNSIKSQSKNNIIALDNVTT